MKFEHVNPPVHNVQGSFDVTLVDKQKLKISEIRTWVRII
jgi:hypothetical protein